MTELLHRRRQGRACVDVIALHLANKGVGHRFDILELESAVRVVQHVSRTEVDRRLRSLRTVNWTIASKCTDKSLGRGEYRLDKIGDHVWKKHYTWPKGRTSCPGPIRRQVLERDKCCRICGVKPGQNYPDQPQRQARLTIGRILPGSRGGAYVISNCRAECMRCNSDARDQYLDEDELLTTVSSQVTPRPSSRSCRTTSPN